MGIIMSVKSTIGYAAMDCPAIHEEDFADEGGFLFRQAPDDEGGAGSGDGEGCSVSPACEGGAEDSYDFYIGVFDVVVGLCK